MMYETRAVAVEIEELDELERYTEVDPGGHGGGK